MPAKNNPRSGRRKRNPWKPLPEPTFAREYPRVENWWGTFRLLPNRMRFAAFFDRVNWLDFRHMHVEPEGGHQGRRQFVSYRLVSQDPKTGRVREFVLKDQDLSVRSQPSEIENALLARGARVQGEKPWGYWRDPWFGHVYSIFERMEGKTLLMEPPSNFPALVNAARQYGRLFSKGLVHQDTGTKHVFVNGPKVKLFDFESLREEPISDYCEVDFGSLMVDAVAHDKIKTKGQVGECVNSFVEGAGLQGKEAIALRERMLKVVLKYLDIRQQSIGIGLRAIKDYAKKRQNMRSLVRVKRMRKQFGQSGFSF